MGAAWRYSGPGEGRDVAGIAAPPVLERGAGQPDDGTTATPRCVLVLKPVVRHRSA
jgi:hypothetical protein